jgi:hypothetical protein
MVRPCQVTLTKSTGAHDVLIRFVHPQQAGGLVNRIPFIFSDSQSDAVATGVAFGTASDY